MQERVTLIPLSPKEKPAPSKQPAKPNEFRIYFYFVTTAFNVNGPAIGARSLLSSTS